MPEVANCTENVGILAHGPGILFEGGRLKYPPEYFVQHLSVCLPLCMLPAPRNFAVLNRNQQESDHYDAMHTGQLANLLR